MQSHTDTFVTSLSVIHHNDWQKNSTYTHKLDFVLQRVVKNGKQTLYSGFCFLKNFCVKII